MLRKKGVVGKFVEFYGPGCRRCPCPTAPPSPTWRPSTAPPSASSRSTPRRSPTCRFTGRPPAHGRPGGGVLPGAGPLPHRGDAGAGLPRHARAGPRRRSSPPWPAPSARRTASRCADDEGAYQTRSARCRRAPAQDDDGRLHREEGAGPLAGGACGGQCAGADRGVRYDLGHGAVVIAAITSCTNTSQPGGDARRRPAGQEGRRARPHHQALGEDLARAGLQGGDRLPAATAGLLPYLEALGFHLVGYGCTTCIGNSGPLPERDRRGRRRDERPGGRRGAVGQPQLRGPHQPAGAGELPGLAAAGGGLRPRRHRRHRPHQGAARHATATASRCTCATSGRPTRRCATPWPRFVKPELFREQYAHVLEGDEHWQALRRPAGRDLRLGPEESTYVRKPPFFDGSPASPRP